MGSDPCIEAQVQKCILYVISTTFLLLFYGLLVPFMLYMFLDGRFTDDPAGGGTYLL